LKEKVHILNSFFFSLNCILLFIKVFFLYVIVTKNLFISTLKHQHLNISKRKRKVGYKMHCFSCNRFFCKKKFLIQVEHHQQKNKSF